MNGLGSRVPGLGSRVWISENVGPLLLTSSSPFSLYFLPFTSHLLSLDARRGTFHFLFSALLKIPAPL